MDFLENLKADGETVPALETKPDLYPWLEEYISAFSLLTNSRRVGMTAGAIPLSEIESYCRLFGVEDPLLFTIFIREMDALFIDHHVNKSKESRSLDFGNKGK